MTPIGKSPWRNRKLWSLASAETLSWAGLFYIFPALLIKWNEWFLWSIGELSIGFTLALIASAITGTIAGRIIDSGNSQKLMTFSVIIGALLLSLLPMVTMLWQFYLVWLLIGCCLAGCLYDPCFSYITRNFQADAKTSIIMITLIAGFASTISYPLCTLITELYDWKTTIYLLTIMLCFIAGPLFWYGTSIEPARCHISVKRSKTSVGKIVKVELSSPVFWGLLMTFAAFSLHQGMIVSQIFPLLESREISPGMTVLFASCIGPMQVVARLILFVTETFGNKEIPIMAVCLTSLICLSLSSLALAMGGTFLMLLVLFVIFQGGPYGLFSIVKPVITAEMLGRVNFGLLSSMVGIGSVWGSALAPGVAGSIADRWNYDAVLITTSSISAVGLMIFLTTTILQRKNPFKLE
jgi:MFS family permease